jgi:hypothetical protein
MIVVSVNFLIYPPQYVFAVDETSPSDTLDFKVKLNLLRLMPYLSERLAYLELSSVRTAKVWTRIPLHSFVRHHCDTTVTFMKQHCNTTMTLLRHLDIRRLKVHRTLL